MAQRTIHYLFADNIAKHVTISDLHRFLLGSILPDAIEPRDRDASHFKIRSDTHTYFDFIAYRNAFFDLMLRDDLYLGYYMHLVEDAFYRVFLYTGRINMSRTPEEVKVLHNDYHILNSYIVKKYQLQNKLTYPVSLEAEPIGSIAPFHIDTFLKELANDFTEQTKGSTVYLTESMLDEFVETYLPLAIEEVKSIKNGFSTLSTRDYSWLRT